MSTIPFRAYRSERGALPTKAVTVSMIVMTNSLVATRWILSKRRYASSLTIPPMRVRLTGWRIVGIHISVTGWC